MFRADMICRYAWRTAAFALVYLSIGKAVADGCVQEFSAPAPEQPSKLFLHSNMAADAYNHGDFAKASREFRWCIGDKPREIEYYDGLYNSCMKTGEWDQVAFALEKIFQLDPSRKKSLGYEYGQALFNLNRFNDAIPVLKAALATVDAPTPVYVPKKRDVLDIKKNAVEPVPAPVPIHSDPPDQIRVDPTHCGPRPFDNAIRSDFIGLAEFVDYDKSREISWDAPPKAHYHITEILKGPPLIPDLPVKYEFHDHVNATMPKGWQFSEKMIPKKGSKWILFFESAAPRHGMFELYQGSYGRQPATDENLNQLYELLDKYNMRNRR